MRGFTSTSINWYDGASVFENYQTLIKRYLKLKGENDTDKFELVLEEYHPIYLRWEYPNITQPCINRLMLLSNNAFEFDLEKTVDFVNSNINIVRSDSIKIETSENEHFQSYKNFKPPLIGYCVIETVPKSSTALSRPPDLVNVRINPIRVDKRNNSWYFNYRISANKTCKVNVLFRMTYVYYTSEKNEILNDNNEGSDTEVSTNVGNEELPTVESPTIKTEAGFVESVPASPFRRSSSLRSSLRSVPVPTQLKEEFQTTSNANTVFYQLDETAQKRLSKSSLNNKT